ncbi:hypothetical protein BDV95DRAFT_564455 [Massariosphaeria phaeospora]|uniref:Uncharacterized protein n=1 Tax=Massariosphaeria phaeospora TaxID=100035 RepID=A0A7C8IIL5_9PLEO|nr:hypothetical protein BDV95DRAFT_564455 [Massariosphaeria phaeospora]
MAYTVSDTSWSMPMAITLLHTIATTLVCLQALASRTSHLQCRTSIHFPRPTLGRLNHPTYINLSLYTIKH